MAWIICTRVRHPVPASDAVAGASREGSSPQVVTSAGRKPR